MTSSPAADAAEAVTEQLGALLVSLRRRGRQVDLRPRPRPAAGAPARPAPPAQEFHRLEIQHFFEIYKELEPGKSVEGTAWVGRVAAEAEIEASRRRLRESGT